MFESKGHKPKSMRFNENVTELSPFTVFMGAETDSMNGITVR